MEIKISVLFFLIIATTDGARQCSPGGKLTVRHPFILDLSSEECIPASECDKYQDDLETLGQAMLSYN